MTTTTPGDDVAREVSHQVMAPGPALDDLGPRRRAAGIRDRPDQGPHLGRDPEQSAPHSAIPALRTALLSNSLWCPATEYARPVSELGEEVRATEILIRRCDYTTTGLRLPAFWTSCMCTPVRTRGKPTARQRSDCS